MKIVNKNVKKYVIKNINKNKQCKKLKWYKNK